MVSEIWTIRELDVLLFKYQTSPVIECLLKGYINILTFNTVVLFKKCLYFGFAMSSEPKMSAPFLPVCKPFSKFKFEVCSKL